MIRVDVAVIGAGLAGAACVRELSRLGIEAVAFERDALPREKVCGGFLSPGALKTLDRLGVLARIREAGAIDVVSARLNLWGKEMRFELPHPGLGVSRYVLDHLLADHNAVQRGSVEEVARQGARFRLRLGSGCIEARIVIDAAGKRSRFTRRAPVPWFGVQYYEPEPRGAVLDFWFSGDAYGGAVTVEGQRSNVCLLVHRRALQHYLEMPGIRVTGPVAYTERHSEYLAVGDAAGMIDPFCGEGMRHALDTGLAAAQVVADGLHRGLSYDRMRRRYEADRDRAWRVKRLEGRFARALLEWPRLAQLAFGAFRESILRELWR